MKRIELAGLNSERKRLIEYLQRCGTVDISDSRFGVLKSCETAGTISQLESNMAQTKAAIELLPRDGGGIFAKRTEIPGEKYKFNQGEAARMQDIVSGILQIKKDFQKNKDELSALEIEEKSLTAFLSLDVPANLKNTRRTVIKTGILEGEWTSEMIWEKLLKLEAEAVWFEILSASKQQTAVFIIYLSDIVKPFCLF